MNRTCNTCDIKIEENNYLKDRTVCKNSYNKSRRKNKNNNTLIQNQQSKIDNVNNFNNNNRTLLVGPFFSSKTYLMLEIFSRIPIERTT